MNLLIGLVASAIIFFQTQYTVLSLGWSLLYGVPLSLFSFWPAALALITLWGGWVFIQYTVEARRTETLLVFSIAVVVVVETMTPMTPLKAYWKQLAINSVQIKNISDKVLLSDEGHPLGMRITFTVAFPSDGDYLVTISKYSPTGPDSLLYPLKLNRFSSSSIEPAPSGTEERPGERSFESHVPYQFTFDATPNFLQSEESDGSYCLDFKPHTRYINYDYSPDDVISAINSADATRYKIHIYVNGTTVYTDAVLLSKYVTKKSYNVKKIYEAALREGIKKCQN